MVPEPPLFLAQARESVLKWWLWTLSGQWAWKRGTYCSKSPVGMGAVTLARLTQSPANLWRPHPVGFLKGFSPGYFAWLKNGWRGLEMLSGLPLKEEMLTLVLGCCWRALEETGALTLLISCGTCELVSLSLEIELWHSPPITAINVLKFCSWWSFCDTENRC